MGLVALENAIGLLQFPYIADDVGEIVVSDLRLRGHVAEFEVMGADTIAGGDLERRVPVVARMVEPVHQRRPLVGAGGVLPMTSKAVRLECLLSCHCRCGECRNHHVGSDHGIRSAFVGIPGRGGANHHDNHDGHEDHRATQALLRWSTA